jgi:PPM family protein phosphatase
MPQDPNTTKGGFWARLRGVAQQPNSEEDVVPTFDDVPVAAPVRPEDLPAGTIPEAVPVAAPVAQPVPMVEAAPVGEGEAPAEPARQEPRPPVEPRPPGPDLCSYCKSPRVGDAEFCFECGMMFPEKPAGGAAATLPAAAAAPAPPSGRLADRYELAEQISVRGEVTRWRGFDHGMGEPRPVILVRSPYAPPTDQTIVMKGQPIVGGPAQDDLHAVPQPAPDEPATASFAKPPLDLPPEWPGVGWEWNVLHRIIHPCVPRVLDHFPEGGFYYLVEEAFGGPLLWDGWEDPSLSPVQRFNALAQLADGLKVLHDAGAILEGLRPDIVTVTPQGHAALNDLSDLLPLPVPAEAPVQANLYTAPELILDREHADGRSDLYSFGAMLYALYLGRELTENDFVRQGVPKPFVEMDPDAHPALARVIMKTFVREKEGRFPTDEAMKDDPTGLCELARVLRGVGRSMAQVRLDIASWTTTGKVRTGNEDAFALIHAVASHQEEEGERALLILADGMGGAEAGEIASRMAIEHLRSLLLGASLSPLGSSGHSIAAESHEEPRAKSQELPEFDVKACQELLTNALIDTNKHILAASKTPGVGKRGMGCTAEVVYMDGQRMVIGHVGDSRTYHYTGGRLKQITRDQTLVNRLIELGHLSEAEAENHPRKNELQQALGGQPFVEPGVYHAPLKPGEWVIVCSDGLTNHVNHATLTEMIQRADSAEMLARRLCNLANLQGGSDNCTVIAVRAT